MMGHGRSDIYHEEDLTFRHAEYAKMIFALLNFLEIDKVNGIGASSGGLTLRYLNVMQPDRFKPVITVGAFVLQQSGPGSDCGIRNGSIQGVGQ